MDELTIKRTIRDEATKVFNELFSFTGRKVTDTPTDSLAVVNRKYVTMNGTTVGRPTSSVIGQSYFDTSINKPIWYNGTSFVDATGTTV